MRRFAIPLLIILAMAALFMYLPSIAPTAALAMLVLGLGFSVVSIVRRQSRQHQASQIDRRAFVLNCVLEIIGILLILGISIVLGRTAMQFVLLRVSGGLGFLLGLLAALGTGVLVGQLVNSTWGRLVKRPASG